MVHNDQDVYDSKEDSKDKDTDKDKMKQYSIYFYLVNLIGIVYMQI